MKMRVSKSPAAASPDYMSKEDAEKMLATYRIEPRECLENDWAYKNGNLPHPHDN
jgi:hypothetical protein